MKKNIIAVSLILTGILFILVSFAGAYSSPKEFESDNVLLKLAVKQGEPVSKIIKLTNTGPISRDFKVTETLDFLSISEKKFSLESNETKPLEINFLNYTPPGVYVGNILVSSGKEELKIPVILEVETNEVLFDSTLNIPLDHREVYPGGSMAVENKLFNLANIGLKSVDIDYIIKDFEGKTIFSEKENIAIENQILTTKLISIPESAKTGDYVLCVTISYSNSFGTSSYFFKIIEEKQELGSSKPFDSWIFIIILSLVTVFFVMFISYRDKVFLEFEKQHRQELIREIEKLDKEKEKIQKLSTGKRKKKLKEFKENKKKRLKAVKIIYRTRVKVLKKLKKQNKTDEMQKRLEEWKKQGYNMNEFLVKTDAKKINLKEKVKNMKKQGYKI